MPAPLPAGLASWRALLAAGIALGVLSRVEERTAGLSLGLSSDAAWVAVAFAAGALAHRGVFAPRGALAPRGAFAGAAVLTVANGAYYALIAATEATSLAAVAGHPARWFALGAAGGALFGAAGRAWRTGAPPVRLLAALLLAGVLVADGAPALRGAPATHAVSLLTGLALVALTARGTRLRLPAAATAAVLVAVAATGALEPLLP